MKNLAMEEPFIILYLSNYRKAKLMERRMLMKKIFSFIITTALLVSILNPISAAAEVKANVSLEKAITTAKSAFDLKTDGYKLSYEYNENQNGRNLWRLSWNREKEPSSSIYVTVDADTGDITSMNRWEYSNKIPGKIPVYSREQALKKAQEIGKKLQPLNFTQTKLYEKTKYGIDPFYTSSDSYTFRFIRVINGIDMQDNGITITLDKNTLEMKNYEFDWDRGSFPDPSKAISLEEAKKVFGEELGIELSYRLIYNYKEKTETPILVYALKDSNKPIDALTGKVLDYSNMYYGGEKAADSAGAPNEAGGLTPEEQSTVDSNSKLISRDGAIAAVQKYVKQALTFQFENAKLFTNETRKTSSWHLSWTKDNGKDKSRSNLSAVVNAETSELISFYLSGEEFSINENAEPKYTEAQAKEIAEKFIKEQQPEKFATTEYRQSRQEIELLKIYPPTKTSGYSFRYVQKQNGALCPFNSFNVIVNPETGEIQSYSMEWVNIELPSTEGAMSLEDAYKALFTNLDFSMQYIRRYNYQENGNPVPEIKLAYILENYSGMIDSKSGAVLDYNGSPVKESKKVEFSDIKGHKSEKDIELLIEMGILNDEGGKFNPNSKLLQKDFVKMIILSIEPYYSTYQDDSKDEYEKYYRAAIDRKIISEKERLPNAQISRQIAAKMLVRALNVGFVGDLSNIYVLPFKDAKLVGESYKGYTAIAAELGIVTPENGYFNPPRHVLRGEAATMLINFLKVDVNVKE